MKVDLRNYDLLVICILSLVLIGVITVVPDNIARIVLGIPFLLFFPGYAFVSVLWPKKELDALERLVLSFGLSIALVPFIGLALNFTSWGIALYPILLSLFGLILSLSVFAYFRRLKLHAQERFSVSFSLALPKRLSVEDKIFSIVIVIALVIGGGLLTYIATQPRVGEPYTNFYILDENRSTRNYPQSLTIGERGSVIIGIVCHEYVTTNYTLGIRLTNETGERQNKTLKQYNNITLLHNEKWEKSFTFSVAESGVYKVKFLLYKNDKFCKALHLWIRAS